MAWIVGRPFPFPIPCAKWVETQVKTDEYANTNDYIRDLIRHDQRRWQALQAAIAQGLDSGRSDVKAEDVMAAAKARLRNG